MPNPYALGQLASALTTATSHEDAATRKRADRRVRAWVSVVEGMASGSLNVGSRTPVAGLPPWVTLEVMRGGFATGNAVAAGPLEEDEIDRMSRLGLPRRREVLFASYLSEAGLAELQELLVSREFEVRIPEDSALLVVAALVRAGDRAGALELLEVLRPHAASLRFMPRSGPVAVQPPGHVYRRTAAEVEDALSSIEPNPRVETQREALSVWLPLTDAFVEFWARRATRGDGDSWTSADRDAARDLLDAYARARRDQPRCRKYSNPKENLPILVSATTAAVEGRLDEPALRRVRHVLACVATSRGLRDSPSFQKVREEQARVVAQPSHSQLAQIAARRCAVLPRAEGIVDVARVVSPVSDPESATAGVPSGTAMPTSVVRKVRLATSAPVEDLVTAGVVPSSEVLAELVPSLTAQQVRTTFADDRLADLMATTYAAFRRRRSLLLLNLEKQIQFTELPWVKAATSAAGITTRVDGPALVASHVAALAIDAFPGTILPNPLVQELSTLYAAGGVNAPLTEELAADIFMGRFSPKYLAAAKLAAGLLRGTLYERYYELDLAEVAALSGPPARPGRARHWLPWRRPRTSPTFADLCTRVAPDGDRWSVARNGVIIERQQILTSHNLAVLVQIGGAEPSRPWGDLAADAAGHSARLLDLAQRQDRPLATVKDAAYAWRQAIFFTSMAGQAAEEAILERFRTLQFADRWPMADVIEDLAQVVGGRGTRDSTLGRSGRPFLGWSIGPHWAVRRASRPVG